MRSLFVRFFLSFWLIIGVTISMAAIGGFWYAERMRDAIEYFELGFEESMLEASQALETDGREGLVNWLEEFPQSYAVSVFVVDEDGRDLLDRKLPYGVQRTFRVHQRHDHHRRRDNSEPRNLRRYRPLPQLVAANGDTFTFIVSPSRIHYPLWANTDTRILLLILALIISGLVSYALGKAISRPVQKLRDATVALADGKLSVRVADSVGKRSDELGLLGRDFNTMAEKLQSAVEQQTELSRNISHELRSPLARMRVAVELARRHAGELAEFDRLNLEAERLDDLIGQILSYTRLDSGDSRETTEIDLADVVSEVAENVNFECKADGIDGVSVSASISNVPKFRGHREALVSAIENVARNAVYQSPANSIVNISLARTGDQTSIEIRDIGAGVDESELSKIFEPFYRSRQSVASEKRRGTGLGLAIAARAVHMNRGEIVALNHSEGGLLVRISLPI